MVLPSPSMQVLARARSVSDQARGNSSPRTCGSAGCRLLTVGSCQAAAVERQRSTTSHGLSPLTLLLLLGWSA